MRNLLTIFITTFILIGCGSTEVNVEEKTEVVDNSPIDFSSIGSIDCRGLSDNGGEIQLKAKITYNDRINRDSFTYTYGMNGNVIDFKTPIMSLTGDGSAILLESDFYIYPNEEDVEEWHIFELTYLEAGATKLFRGGCYQDVYVSPAVIKSSCPFAKD